MNVYNCCYRGNIGYSCRLRGRRWMFVPETGQVDRRIHRDVTLSELIFADPRAKSWEMNRERRRRGALPWLKSVLGGSEESRSVGGMLFTAG